MKSWLKKTDDKIDKRQYRTRRISGQFDYDDMTLICKCGHPLSVHAGDNETKKRNCLNEDCGIEGATGESCSCKNFTKQ